MTPFKLVHWFKSVCNARPRTFVKKPRLRLLIEELETRLVPASHLWTGGAGADTRWSTAANWSGGAPSAATPLDDLSFPSGPTSLVTNNDLSGLVLNSIQVSGAGYTLAGKPITLGDPSASGSGTLTVNTGAINTNINFDIQLAGQAGTKQFFTVNQTADVTVAGHLSGTTGSELTKEGLGTLTLTNDNSGFTGPITVDNNSGVLAITNAKALGDTTSPTTVGTNSQLQVSNVVGPIAENLLLNGSGISNDGALLNVAGNNTWSGNVELDKDADLGSNAGSLNIMGQISDNGAGHNLTKDGIGQIVFGHVGGNTYRGTTTINNGILQIEDPFSLGTAGTAANGTIVNSSLNGSGTLQLNDPSGGGFIVMDEQLTLNGPGAGGIGAIDSLNGQNEWAGNIILGSLAPNGSNVQMGSEVTNQVTSNLIVSGVISNPNGAFNLTKVGPGRVTFNNANTYSTSTTINTGILNIRDSQALGTSATPVTVAGGAALEYQVDSGFDPHGRNLGDDSVTHNALQLNISRPLVISGTGVNNTGALRNVSGINIQTSGITLAGAAAAIGVDPDPNPKSDNTYFTNDYSLTVNGVISNIVNPPPFFDKVGTGQLILTAINTYTGSTNIEQGWITIQNDQALGSRIPGRGDTVQPGTTVFSGAALHLKPLLAGGSLNVPENLTLAGLGITHPFSQISQQGALMSLGGMNVETGDIHMIGNVGVGVQNLGPAVSSELTLTGSMSEAVPVPITLNASQNGGSAQDLRIYDTGSLSGTLTINYDMFGAT